MSLQVVRPCVTERRGGVVKKCPYLRDYIYEWRLAYVSLIFLYLSFQDLNSPPASPTKEFGPSKFGSSSGLPPVLRRKNNNSNNLQVNDTSLKTQYRCSLINLDECTQDDELDAILGELSVLESQFDEEINNDHKNHHKDRDLKKDASPVESEGSDRSSGMHSRYFFVKHIFLKLLLLNFSLSSRPNKSY